MSRSQVQILLNHVKGLVIRNTHVQYESPTSSVMKVIANVRVFGVNLFWHLLVITFQLLKLHCLAKDH